MSIFVIKSLPRMAVLAAAWTGSPSLFAQASKATSNREEFQSFYQNQKNSRTSFFGGAPSHHITPKRDNISFAMDSQIVDVGVAPQLDDMPDNIADLDNRLEMTGWSLSPLVAFSSKNFGVGFTGEAGERQVKYLSRSLATTDTPGYFVEQYSSMKYSGAGLYAFALLRSINLPRWLSGTLIIGGRTLTATHETRGTRTDSTKEVAPTKLKYDVNSYDFGFNIGATLAKRFTVIPWTNYRSTHLGSIKDRNEKSASESVTQDTLDVVELDRSLTWLSNSNFTYGIDFAVQFDLLEVHFGGILGYLASLNRGAERVHDKSISASFSYNFKSQ